MEQSTRRWFVVSAVVSGLLTAIGWLASVYAFAAKPEIHEVIFPDVHEHLSAVSKLFFLFTFPAIQTILFAMALYPVVGWRRFIRKSRERAAPYDLWRTDIKGATFSTACRAASVAACVASIINLNIGLQRVHFLLDKF